MNSRYRDKIEASVGGDISIDIYNLGRDKKQVVDYLSDINFSEVTFVGDRIRLGGNDYSLAQSVKEKGGKSINVKNWRETRIILLNT